MTIFLRQKSQNHSLLSREQHSYLKESGQLSLNACCFVFLEIESEIKINYLPSLFIERFTKFAY